MAKKTKADKKKKDRGNKTLPSERENSVYEMSDGMNRKENETNKAHNNFSIFGKKGDGRDKIEVIGVWVNSFILLTAVVATIFSYTALNLTRKSMQSIEYSFKIQHRPYLQIQDIQTKGDTIFYSLTNLGQYPAQIISGQFGVMGTFGFMDKTMEVGDMMIENGEGGIKPLFDPTIINTYIVKESPVKRFYWQDYSKGITGVGNIRFMGKIYYTNEVTGDKRAYIFTIDLKTFEFIRNENKDI